MDGDRDKLQKAAGALKVIFKALCILSAIGFALFTVLVLPMVYILSGIELSAHGLLGELLSVINQGRTQISGLAAVLAFVPLDVQLLCAAFFFSCAAKLCTLLSVDFRFHRRQVLCVGAVSLAAALAPTAAGVIASLFTESFPAGRALFDGWIYFVIFAAAMLSVVIFDKKQIKE